VGRANIAQKNWTILSNSGNAILTAVASRGTNRGRRFIEACQAQAPLIARIHEKLAEV
jgi:hypothetical protein